MNKIPLLWCLSLALVSAQAEVALDGSFGSSGALTGPDFVVDAGMGRQAGSNLFHSFSQFSIQQGQSATFKG
jgi:large exoprotein involved in heme utilization and adhesion